MRRWSTPVRPLPGAFARGRRGQRSPVRAAALSYLAAFALSVLYMHHSLAHSAPGPRLLLYLPIHTSEFTHLDAFLECLGAHSPGSGQPSRLPTDILVVTTGAELQRRQATVVLRFSTALAAALRPHADKRRAAAPTES